MKILDKIRSVLPSTRSFVNRRFDEEMLTLLEINNTIKNISVIFNTIDKELKVQLDSDLNNIKKQLQQLSEEITETRKRVIGNYNAIKSVDAHISNKPILWNNQFEKKIVASNWGDICNSEEFTAKFMKLIKGLDEASIDCVERILQRQHFYLNNSNGAHNLYTISEQEDIRKLDDEFRKRIFKVADDIYAYKKYLLPLNHFEASVFYYKLGISKIYIPDSLADKSIIDVGAFIGDSVLILNEIPHKNIIAFEADPDNYRLLKRTVEMNEVANVICENCALGSESGSIRLHKLGPMSSVIDRKGVDFGEDVKVKQCTLDSYIEEKRISCGLIKVDIEGGEPLFLQGAKKTIIEQKPILLLSIYHNAHDFFELKPLLEEWDVGYHFSIYKPTDGNVTSETLLIASV